MTTIAQTLVSKLEAMTFRNASLADSDRRGRPASFEAPGQLWLTEAERDFLLSALVTDRR